MFLEFEDNKRVKICYPGVDNKSLFFVSDIAMEAFSLKKTATRLRVALLGASAVSAIALLFMANPGSAAAPSALTSLTGTPMSIAVNATTAINALTFSDTNPSEVVVANGLKIRIPSTVNAIWDSSDTTAAVSGSAASSTGATPTVSFSTDKKVLTITALDRFTPSSSITISGLSIIGVNYETAPAALEYATDGSTYGTADATTQIAVTPGTLLSTNVEPATLTSGVSSTSTISFTMTTSTPKNGKIAVTFPTGFDLTTVAVLDGTCTSMDGTFTTAVSSQTVTITRANDGTIEPAGPQTCAIGRVINPGAGTAGTYTIETQAAAGAAQTIETASATADTFTAGALTVINVEPRSLIRGLSNTVDVLFTTATSIPITGKIVVVFPDGFNLTGAGSGTCSTMDGTFATSIAGNTVTITRSSGSIQTAAAETCTIAGVINPSSSGLGGTYQVKMQNSAGVTIDQNTNVAADTFSAPAGAGNGGGDLTPPGSVTGVSITLGADAHSAVMHWTNPTDTDLASVRILRSTVSGTFGTAITQALVSTYTDAGLTAGVTYYYTFQPVDATGNVRVDTTEYALIATPGAVAPPPSTPTSTPETAPSTPPSSAPPVTFPAGVAAADVIRGSTTAVYFVSADGKRHVFPSQTVFLSWYPDFSAVKTVADSALAALPLGKNVTMRPGTHLVKIISNPKVYAVEPNGIIRWIPSEETARTLYGNAWATRVQDVDPILFADYTEGDMVLVTALPAGMVASDGSGGYWWIVRDVSATSRRSASAAALVLQRFSGSFTVPSLASLPSVVGSNITSLEAGLALPY